MHHFKNLKCPFTIEKWLAWAKMSSKNYISCIYFFHVSPVNHLIKFAVWLPSICHSAENVMKHHGLLEKMGTKCSLPNNRFITWILKLTIPYSILYLHVFIHQLSMMIFIFRVFTWVKTKIQCGISCQRRYCPRFMQLYFAST